MSAHEKKLRSEMHSHHLIVQNCNGTTPGQTIEPQKSKIANEKSAIYASSLFAQLDATGQNTANPKGSDDKIVIGYANDGLPFMIIVDGFFGGEKQATFDFIDQHITPYINSLRDKLRETDDSKAALATFIHTIYDFQKTLGCGAEFTMSLAITYRKEQALRISGFGVGDTCLVLKRQDGTIEQLAFHTLVDDFKDAFDNFCSTNPEKVIERNTCFDVLCAEGDEVVGYTYAPQSLEVEVESFPSTHINKKVSDLQTITKQKLNPALFDASQPLFGQLIQKAQEAKERAIEHAIGAKEPLRFGDDFTVGTVTIPDMVLAQTIKKTLASRAKLEAPKGITSIFSLTPEDKEPSYKKIEGGCTIS